MQTQAPKTWEDVLRMPDDGNRYEFIGAGFSPAAPDHDTSKRGPQVRGPAGSTSSLARPPRFHHPRARQSAQLDMRDP